MCLLDRPLVPGANLALDTVYLDYQRLVDHLPVWKKSIRGWIVYVHIGEHKDSRWEPYPGSVSQAPIRLERHNSDFGTARRCVATGLTVLGWLSCLT
jgi:hypothetical protein